MPIHPPPVSPFSFASRRRVHANVAQIPIREREHPVHRETQPQRPDVPVPCVEYRARTGTHFHLVQTAISYLVHARTTHAHIPAIAQQCRRACMHVVSAACMHRLTAVCVRA